MQDIEGRKPSQTGKCMQMQANEAPGALLLLEINDN